MMKVFAPNHIYLRAHYIHNMIIGDAFDCPYQQQPVLSGHHRHACADCSQVVPLTNAIISGLELDSTFRGGDNNLEQTDIV
jgi:hypothetical protein